MTVYRLYVFLLDIAPPIWRRIELSSETSLAQLHKVLQAAMGWQDYHLHESRSAVNATECPTPITINREKSSRTVLLTVQGSSEERFQPAL